MTDGRPQLEAGRMYAITTSIALEATAPPSPDAVMAEIRKAIEAIDRATIIIACHPDDAPRIEAEIARRRAVGEVLLIEVQPSSWLEPGTAYALPKNPASTWDLAEKGRTP